MTDRTTLQPILDRLEGRASWWVDIGPGWHPIVRELDRQIAELAPDYRVLQVKEKFGGLRYYISYPAGLDEDTTDRIDALILAAEDESFRTCEDCGQPGRERSGGWIRTLCDDCEQARVERREAMG